MQDGEQVTVGGDHNDQASESDSELGTAQQRAGVGAMTKIVRESGAAAVRRENQL